MRLFVCFILLATITGCTKTQPSIVPPYKQISFAVKDGAEVFGDLSEVKNPNGIIILFHQAGSSAKEYSPFIPLLNSFDWTCLAVDLRAGGSMYGTNRTVEKLGRESNYMSAYQDMEAAVDYATSQKYKRIVVWGSSYSASLVAKLASERKSIEKVISFSPGEYMEGKSTVHEWYLKVKVPILAVWASGEQSDVRSLLNGTKATIVGSEDYIHGSSTLRNDKNVKNRYVLWKKIEEFLNAN